VARNIQRVRKARQLKQSDVSERLTAAGRPTLPTVVSKIERGERRIDVDDLVAFGRALGVPPILLLYPLGEEEEVEVLAGQRASTWAAFRWFVGEARFPVDNLVGCGEVDPATGLHEWYDDPEQGWEAAASPVALWRQHADQIRDWFQAPSAVRRLGLDEADARTELARRLAAVEDAVKQTRAAMRMSGLKPPALPEELAELDSPLGP
jgi:transcriptional regulator with XRE-family HTH domain